MAFLDMLAKHDLSILVAFFMATLSTFKAERQTGRQIHRKRKTLTMTYRQKTLVN